MSVRLGYINHATGLDLEKNPKGRFSELRTSLAARHLIGTRDDLVWLPRSPSPYAGPARASGATATNGGGEGVAPITLDERDALKARGFSGEDLFGMTPQHARDILADANRNPDSERFKVVGQVMGTTACVKCGKAGGVQMIKDSRSSGTKPKALHHGCARDWFESEDAPLE